MTAASSGGASARLAARRPPLPCPLPISRAPTRAKGAVIPARTLGAPHTTLKRPSAPASTSHRFSRSALGWLLDVEHPRDEHAAEAGRRAVRRFRPPARRASGAGKFPRRRPRRVTNSREPTERQLHRTTSAQRRELAQEAQVVFEEQAHVVDAELEQRRCARRPCRRRSPGTRPDRTRPRAARWDESFRSREFRSIRYACTRGIPRRRRAGN